MGVLEHLSSPVRPNIPPREILGPYGHGCEAPSSEPGLSASCASVHLFICFSGVREQMSVPLCPRHCEGAGMWNVHESKSSRKFFAKLESYSNRQCPDDCWPLKALGLAQRPSLDSQ